MCSSWGTTFIWTIANYSSIFTLIIVGNWTICTSLTEQALESCMRTELVDPKSAVTPIYIFVQSLPYTTTYHDVYSCYRHSSHIIPSLHTSHCNNDSSLLHPGDSIHAVSQRTGGERSARISCSALETRVSKLVNETFCDVGLQVVEVPCSRLSIRGGSCGRTCKIPPRKPRTVGNFISWKGIWPPCAVCHSLCVAAGDNTSVAPGRFALVP
jgi:hypothetical protein